MKKNIYFFLAVFLLSLSVRAQHTLTLTADPTDGGTVSGAGNYAAGTQVSVSADANTGFQFVNWTTNIPNTVTFTGAGNANYNTDFIRFGTSGGKPQWRSANNQYYIYWEPGDGWYTYTMVGGETYAYANYQDTPIPPKTGWELYDETGAVPALNYELTVSTQASFDYTMQAGNVTLTANFEASSDPTYNLTLLANPTDGGTVSGAGNYAAGTLVPVSATAAPGYQFANWTINSEKSAAKGEKSTALEVAGAGTVAANGTYVQDGDVNGKPRYVKGAFEIYFQMGGWLLVDNSVGTEFLYFIMSEAPTPPQDGWQVFNGTPPAPTVTPAGGGDNDNVVSDQASFTYEMPSEHVTLTANFEELSGPILYTLTLLANPEEGGIPIGAGEYEAGETILIQLIVNPGYQFFKWERDGAHFSWIMNFSYTMPAEDVTLTAILNEVFALNLEVSPAGAGTVTGAGNFPAGAQRQVSATANHGFSFVNWTDELDNEVSDAPAFTYTMPANAVTLTANFQEAQPVVINEFPWLEDFEPAVFPPDGWSRVNTQGAENWIRTNAPGGGFAAKHNYGSFQEDTWLITPAIEVPQTGEYELSFRHYNIYADYYPGVGGNNVMISSGSSNPADDEYTQAWSPATVLESTWENVTLSLSAYAGQTIYIAFRYYADYTHDWFVDDVKIEALPSEMFTVTLLADPNDIGAVLTGEGDYETGASVTIAAANVAGYAFTGWTGLAEDIALLADASALSTNFTMPDRNVTFTANFEEAGEPAGTSCENPFIVTLPLVDFQNTTTDKGDNYSSNWINPPSNFINGNDMVLKFTVSETGLLSGSMTANNSWIGVFIMQDCPNPTSPAIMKAWSTSFTNSLTLPSSNSAQPQEILLTPGDYFLIVSSYPPPQTIDFTLNLELEPLGGCASPMVLTASNLTQNSADLGWTAAGSESTWNILYGTPGFDVNNEGTLIENVTTKPYTLDGLDAGTTYEFYVQAVCDGGLTSDWAGPRAFTTECASAITAPFVEGFESESAPPACWAMWYANPNPPVENLMSHSTDIAYSGSRSFRFASWTSVGGPPYEQFLRTPELDFGTNMMVSFKYSRNVMGSVGFAVGTSVNGTDWEWQDDVTDAQYLTWKTYTLHVSSDVKYVVIKYKGQFQRYLYIDDFSIERAYTVDFAVVETDGNTHGTLTAAVNGSLISSGSGVTEGTNIVFTATPETGYRIKEWTLNGDIIQVNGNPFLNPVLMYENIAENIDITVEFEVMPMFDLTLEVNPANAGTVAGAGQHGEGQSIAISATPNSGYAFVNWTDAQNSIVSTQASFNFTMPAQNTVLTANFSAMEYELVLLPDPVVGGVLTGAGNYLVGSPVTITATANTGFEFVNWIDVDGNEISNEANFTYTMPASNVLLIANFNAIPMYTLTLAASPAQGGTVTGAGSYAEGAVVPLQAIANTNYHFVRWIDSQANSISTEANFSFTMPASHTTLTALFELENSVNEVGVKPINIYPNPARETFTILSGEIIQQVVITDITGKVVFSDIPNSQELQINRAFEKGIYIVNIYTESGIINRKLQIQ